MENLNIIGKNGKRVNAFEALDPLIEDSIKEKKQKKARKTDELPRDSTKEKGGMAPPTEDAS